MGASHSKPKPHYRKPTISPPHGPSHAKSKPTKLTGHAAYAAPCAPTISLSRKSQMKKTSNYHAIVSSGYRNPPKPPPAVSSCPTTTAKASAGPYQTRKPVALPPPPPPQGEYPSYPPWIDSLGQPRNGSRYANRPLPPLPGQNVKIQAAYAPLSSIGKSNGSGIFDFDARVWAEGQFAGDVWRR